MKERKGVEQCRNGILISSQEHLKKLLKPYDNDTKTWRLPEIAVDAFLAYFETRHAVHLSSFLRNVQDQDAQPVSSPDHRAARLLLFATAWITCL